MNSLNEERIWKKKRENENEMLNKKMHSKLTGSTIMWSSVTVDLSIAQFDVNILALLFLIFDYVST